MKRCGLLAILVGACGAGGHEVCRLPSPPLVAPRAPAARTRNLILVTIDGVRWQDLFGGAPCHTPNLRALGEAGVALGEHAAPVMSSGPRFVSLPGYRETVSYTHLTLPTSDL